MTWSGRVRRWDLFWADLEPHLGSEQGGERRPVLVLSNDGANEHLGIVTVIPATKREGKRRRVYPFEVLLPAGAITGRHASILMPQQIRTISRKRLLDRIGRIASATRQLEIERRVLEHLGIRFEAEGLDTT